MKRKVLAAFLLAVIAIGVALMISRFSFRAMMGTVEQLASPNEKLTRLNRVFEEITVLDQQQRAEAIQNPLKPYKYFLDQSGYVRAMIDTLTNLPWDSIQRTKLRSMRDILDQRNQTFVAYLKVRADLSNNREFSHQLDTLASLLRENQGFKDSIITKQQKTITTYVREDSIQKKEDRGFLKKLFRKKNKQAEQPQVAVKEEFNLVTDTLQVAKQGLDILQVERMMRAMKSDHSSQRKVLQQRELDLINANSLFIHQLVSILNTVQQEELQRMQASNDAAAKVVSDGISRMNLLMLGFFLAAALLVYLILVDISRSNYYKKQLEAARDHAEELSQIKQRFLANMSHEIRTPLQSILGFAEQLRENPASQEEAAQAIYSSSEHLLQIVNEVLDYSRISSGKFSLANEPISLITLIREIESAMRIQAQRKKLSFIIDTEAIGDLVISGDAFRIRQILYNLVGNAIKFTHQGFVRLSVRAETHDQKAVCSFDVTDTGIGMTELEAGRIFSQFEQANADVTKTYGGTGLGLSIVKALVDTMGGTLHVKSVPGAGSSFRVTLPFEKAVLNNDENRSLPGIATDKVKKVLVVDDDPMILRLCSLILDKNRIPNVVYNHPGDILVQVPDPAVTHIFLDIRMPEINGAELCEKLRMKYDEHVQFIALTAHVLPEERHNLFERGFDLVLCKPFMEQDMLRVLGKLPAPPHYIPDLSQLRKMTLGDDRLFQSVLQQFISETSRDLGQLHTVSVRADAMAIREIIHKLSGRFGQVGFKSLAAELHEIESKLLKEKPLTDELVDEITDLREEIALLLDEIRKMEMAGSL